jgi:predicted PurR-regulated permease PerM
LALVVIGGLGYFPVSTTINQLVSFALNIPNLLKPSTPGHPSPINRLLGPLGITDAQINAARQQILNWLESSAGQIVSSAVPIITSVATGIVDAIIVFILSIYLTADGPRLYRRLSTTPPRKVRTRLVFLSLHAAPHGRRLHSRAVVHVRLYWHIGW